MKSTSAGVLAAGTPTQVSPTSGYTLARLETSKFVLDLCAYVAYIFSVPATVKQPKSERFATRMTTADKQVFQMAAAIEGRSLAKFILVHTIAVARHIVAKNSQIELNHSQSRHFVDVLLAPPRQPTTALKQAMAKYRRQVTEA